MFSVTFRRRAAIDSFLFAGNLTSISTASAAAAFTGTATEVLSDSILEQFFPPRESPHSQLPLKLRLELLHHLSTALKTDPRCSAAASAILLDYRPAPLADLLRSLRHPRPGLAFLSLAFPILSPASFVCCCDAAFLLFLAKKLKPLAQDLLAGLLGRLSPCRSAKLLHWASLHRCRTSSYYALHLVLRAYLGAGMVPQALEALSEIRRVGKTPSLSVLAIVLRLLFRMGDSRKAWKLFRDMILQGPLPSIRTFNAMILGSCLRGKVAAAEALIWLMPKFNLEPDACSFNIVMKARCSFGQAGDAFKLFKEMLVSSYVPSIVTYNILIHALCRQGRMDQARRWFDHIVEDGNDANTITYNVLLDGYVKAGQIDIAYSTYKEMIKKGLEPDLYTFNILVGGHYKFRRDCQGVVQNLFRDTLNDEVCTHMLISNFCWNGQLECARSLLPQDASDVFLPSVAVFNSVIAGYSKEGLEEEAIYMFRVMVDEFGLVPSASTWQSLLLGLCRVGRLSEARELLYEIVERGFNVGTAAFTIFIDGCFRVGKVSEACLCWNYIERKGISLDVVGFSAYINGLCQAMYMEKALEAFDEMLRRGLIPNNLTYNSLIYGLCRYGDVEEALKLEAEMRSNGLIPDTFTTNIVINGLCQQRCLEKADGKFKEMGWNGLHPDIVTYNTLIAACYKAFDPGRAERYIEVMAFKDCKPDIFTYNIKIHSLCSSYRTTEAMKAVDKLISEGFAPNTVTHNTVMNGICADSLGRAMILTAKLIKMAFVPNVVTVNLLLSHFCKQGLSESALMWAEKFKMAYFNFDDVTYNIFDKAIGLMRKGSDVSSKLEPGKDLFLEFLMHITYELVCNNSRVPKHKPLTITSLVHTSLTGTSKMMDVR